VLAPPAPPEWVAVAYTRCVDDGLPPTDDAAAPRFPGSGTRGEPRDPRREDSLTTRRRPSGRAGREVIDPLLGGGHPAASRSAKQRQQPVVDPFGGDPLTIRDDPTLDLPSTPPTPRPSAAHPPESLDALLDRGPVTLPAIIPAEPATAPDPAVGRASTPVLPVLPPVATPSPTPATPWSPVARAQQGAAAATTHTGARHHRVRRVTRVVRHVDAWSVFKVAIVFNLFLYVVTLTAGVLLWQVAQNTGTVDNIERFFENFGWESFTLHGGEIFHNAWIAGLFLVVGMTGFAVLMATLFNLITDLVGGIRVSVLEEEVVAREAGQATAGSSPLARRWQQLRHRG